MKAQCKDATYEKLNSEFDRKDFRRFVEVLFRRGVRLCKERKPESMDIPQEHDEFFEEIFEEVGYKYGITSERVQNYVIIDVSRMLKNAKQKMNEELGFDIELSKDFLTLENFLIFMYALVCREMRENYYQNEVAQH